LAAQWHAHDVLNNRDLDGDVGSDGLAAQDRANAAASTASRPKRSRSTRAGDQWHRDHEPVVLPADYMAIMSNCANTQIGVWSESSLSAPSSSAVYGQPVAP